MNQCFLTADEKRTAKLEERTASTQNFVGLLLIKIKNYGEKKQKNVKNIICIKAINIKQLLVRMQLVLAR
jgi:hypothetical protein